MDKIPEDKTVWSSDSVKRRPPPQPPLHALTIPYGFISLWLSDLNFFFQK